MGEAKNRMMSEEEFIRHQIGDKYSLTNRNGSIEHGFMVAYMKLPGTYKRGVWMEYGEYVTLIEKPMKVGTDFREVPIRFLNRQ